MKKIIGLTFAILALSACSPEEAFIGGTLAGIIVSDASNERAQRSVTHRETVFIDRHYQPRGHWEGNNYYPPLYAHPRRGYIYGNNYYPRAHPRRGYLRGNKYCYDRFNGYYRPRYC